jgi:bifunctional DNase/RNase
MRKIQLEIVGLSYSQSQSGAYALILGEVGGKRRLPIIIGGFEAQAIAIEIEKMKPTRPLTHDLFKGFADAFKITIREVIINKFLEGIFHALLICDDGTQECQIDARTSDAVALALRFHCPIFTYESIMAKAGIEVDEKKAPEGKQEKVKKEKPRETSFEQHNLEELKDMLKKAVANEEYEKASVLRDEINKRKGKT